MYSYDEMDHYDGQFCKQFHFNLSTKRMTQKQRELHEVTHASHRTSILMFSPNNHHHHCRSSYQKSGTIRNGMFLQKSTVSKIMCDGSSRNGVEEAS
jgi:hypothetical protein